MLIAADIINAILETIGGLILWLHVARVRRDRMIRGVHWAPFVFFFSWGLWNVGYYPFIGQWVSGVAAIMPTIANGTFLYMLFRYRRGGGAR